MSVGHTGAIIPTGKLEKVRIGGVYVSSVLLNNFSEISRLGLGVGDKVTIILAGDIIPAVVGIAEKTIRYECPKCGFVGTLDEQQEHHNT